MSMSRSRSAKAPASGLEKGIATQYLGLEKRMASFLSICSGGQPLTTLARRFVLLTISGCCATRRKHARPDAQRPEHPDSGLLSAGFLDQQTAYRHYPVAGNGLPVSGMPGREVISLPMDPYLTKQTQERECGQRGNF